MRKRKIINVLLSIGCVFLSACSAGMKTSLDSSMSNDTTFSHYFELSLAYQYEIKKANNTDYKISYYEHLYGKNDSATWTINCTMTNSYKFSRQPSYEIAELYRPLYDRLTEVLNYYGAPDERIALHPHGEELTYDVNLLNPFGRPASVIIVSDYFPLFVEVFNDDRKLDNFYLYVPFRSGFYLYDGENVSDFKGENIEPFSVFIDGMKAERKDPNTYESV